MKKLRMTKHGQSIEEKLRILAENNKALLENAQERGETEVPMMYSDGSVRNVSLFDAMVDAVDCEKTIDEIVKENPNYKDPKYQG